MAESGSDPGSWWFKSLWDGRKRTRRKLGQTWIVFRSQKAAEKAIEDAREKTQESDKEDGRETPYDTPGFEKGRLGVEYCGLICKRCDEDGKDEYSITGPIPGTRNDRTPGDAPYPDGWTREGDYHTHPSGGPPAGGDYDRVGQGTGYVGGGATGDPNYEYGKTWPRNDAGRVNGPPERWKGVF